ncbi:MAG: carboxylating nicotinate-nucleotide diphosphorylase, partial [Clostridiales bacterium]|nr:carboxylating nicotinate-nucleotide diphosphorylase [Clostridiales bacterium]
MYFLGLDEFIRRALDEDIGTGDITTISCIPEDAVSKGVFRAKEPGIICGIDILTRVFAMLDEEVVVTPFVSDGALVEKGDTIAEIKGNSRIILSGERVALNLIQRLSGIATRTHAAIKQVSGTNAYIVDTRKTTPGLRVLEKYAVKTGGGKNHRFNLADGVLIKDNHIKAAGGIAEAIEAVRKTAPHTLKIEVETETAEQIDEALAAGADIIMLDNMTLDEMAA